MVTEKVGRTLDEMPLLVKVVVWVGFPIFVAMWFMAESAGLFPSFVKANNTILKENQVLIEETVEGHREQIGILRTMCVHQASGPEQQRDCINPQH